jgi:hypothetical protein
LRVATARLKIVVSCHRSDHPQSRGVTASGAASETCHKHPIYGDDQEIRYDVHARGRRVQ